MPVSLAAGCLAAPGKEAESHSSPPAAGLESGLPAPFTPFPGVQHVNGPSAAFLGVSPSACAVLSKSRSLCNCRTAVSHAFCSSLGRNCFSLVLAGQGCEAVAVSESPGDRSCTGSPSGSFPRPNANPVINPNKQMNSPGFCRRLLSP